MTNPSPWRPFGLMSWFLPLAAYRPGGHPPAPADSLASRINERYDSAMYSRYIDEYYDRSGFHNYGYWTPGTKSQREASENLVDRLLEFVPHKSGTILDVACGMGASTRRLLRHYKPSAVTGINISDKQLATCRRTAPGCRFLNMNATDLKFPDGSFDNILCVEAVFHFETRDRFLREAYRVLKPGGHLVLSDILLRSRFVMGLGGRVPPANFVPDLERYRALFERVGYQDVRVVEARDSCWKGFRDHSLAFAWCKVLTGQASAAALKRIANWLDQCDLNIVHYLLVSARKPARGGADCRPIAGRSSRGEAGSRTNGRRSSRGDR